MEVALGGVMEEMGRGGRLLERTAGCHVGGEGGKKESKGLCHGGLRGHSNDWSAEAEEIVYVLKSLVSSYIDNEDIFQNSKTYADSVNHVIELRRINAVLPFFKPLEGTLKNGMLLKLAKKNLTFDVLQKKFHEEGEEGLLSTLTLLRNGKPQITKNRHILAQISAFFKSKNICD
ncbi:hypothetical protein PV327_010166 [Microctonus hyperodae]|uniref:PML C-terminal domain-containing protein n=1 Tax=Microctonus hyperodae TaxID=165561 RepID=A0AA39FRB5_MICHY|nr:hypothetical protein PV327_010166 [Microctonus hyperodae]